MAHHRSWSVLAVCLCLTAVDRGAAKHIPTTEFAANAGDDAWRTGSATGPRTGAPAASDLDAFMERVLTRRDENWRKLQQYVLDERERAALVGPDGGRLFGLEREYTWYIREGVFVRSPVRFDGVPIADAERRAYEAKWIARERAREARQSAAAGSHGGEARDREAGEPAAADHPVPAAADRDALARLTREPQFVSAAYFLRFRFEPGRYALAGREQYEGRQVLRIEYYPARLFAGDPDGARHREHDDAEDSLARQMNKVSLVTLWIEPAAHQIVKYTFENIDTDFLPGRSLVRVHDLRATMTMGEPFVGVWLPTGIDAHGSVTLASGTFGLRYSVRYRDYREADVKVRVR